MRRGLFLLLAFGILIGCVAWLTSQKAGDSTARSDLDPPSDSGASNNADDSAKGEFQLSDWLEQHSAGIEIRQDVGADNPFNRGAIVVDGEKVDLGETPPIYSHQLKTEGCPILLGGSEDRGYVRRSIRPVVLEDSGITIKSGVSISVPRMAPRVGVAFKSEQNPIREIGLIVPEIELPAGVPEGQEPWDISIRINGRPSDVALSEISEQSIGGELVILTPYGDLVEPSDNLEGDTAKIIWLKIEVDGTMGRSED